MGQVLYSRGYYQLDEESARKIVDKIKTKDSLLPTPEFPPDHPWPIPNIAVESSFVMVLMQGYLSSPSVPYEMKHGLLSVYEELVDMSIEDKDEREAIKIKGQYMIQAGESVRQLVIKLGEEQERKNTEEKTDDEGNNAESEG